VSGYLDAYGAFRSTGGFTPAEQEVVFRVIRRVNRCSYCIAARTFSNCTNFLTGPDLDAVFAPYRLA